MASMKIEKCVVGLVQTNCYFIINEDTKETLVVDPGANADKLIELLEKDALKPAAVLLTHGHFDHAGAAARLAEHFSILVYAEEHEKETLETPGLNLSFWEGAERVYHADVFVKDEQELTLAGFYIRVLATPGHTVGGCCYYFPNENVLFSGDTLFEQSIGRTDFPKGSASCLIRKIREKLMVLPEETKVYAGHGNVTTIGTERVYNPFL